MRHPGPMRFLIGWIFLTCLLSGCDHESMHPRRDDPKQTNLVPSRRLTSSKTTEQRCHKGATLCLGCISNGIRGEIFSVGPIQHRPFTGDDCYFSDAVSTHCQTLPPRVAGHFKGLIEMQSSLLPGDVVYLCRVLYSIPSRLPAIAPF